MDRFDFSDKKIVVTGASSGVGREVAIQLSEANAKVVLIARREEELKKTLSMMKGTSHIYKVVDLSEFDQVIAMITEIVKEDNRRINGIAHCAGTVVPAPLRSITKTMLDYTLQGNLYSFAALLKCAAKKKLFQDGGAVVGISSIVALHGQVGNSVYGASKGAMDAIMRTAAKELQPRGIRVNTICPEGIKTAMLANLALNGTKNGDISLLPDDLMLPEKVASIVVALLSDSMQYVSGVSLVVDEAKF